MRIKILALILALTLCPACASAGIQMETGSLLPIGMGDDGNLTRRVQERLIELGFSFGLPDGLYGYQTSQAVKWAQRSLNSSGIPSLVNGEVDEVLYHCLMADDFPVSNTELKLASWGDEVTRLQRRLLMLGYLSTVTGTYASITQVAVAAFQARNGLLPDGVASKETLAALYSKDAIPAQSPEHELLVYVSCAEQRVYVYKWAEGKYSGPIKTFLCSTGTKGSDTITGVFKTQEHCGEWYYFGAFDVWAKYAIRVRGPYLFHSTLYSRRDDDTAQQSSIRALGRKDSHGCIRLAIDDIFWLYHNTKPGFVAIIY